MDRSSRPLEEQLEQCAVAFVVVEKRSLSRIPEARSATLPGSRSRQNCGREDTDAAGVWREHLGGSTIVDDDD